ncbi:hypothetical protein LCGC14_1829860 [marine sediment metagenome]|uniref:Uncharacterized protein n=1 Tax=marine sediment metagenome TaxID=412755 RepID=A0A0F9JG02_9ZZZZ
MKRNWRSIGLVFLGLSVLGFGQGCAELKELRTANSRQAITIRDQMDELVSFPILIIYLFFNSGLLVGYIQLLHLPVQGRKVYTESPGRRVLVPVVL